MSGSRPISSTVCQVFLLIILFLLIASTATPVRAEAECPRHNVTDSWSVREIVRSLEPAIVWIVAQLGENEYSQGTGFIIREDGYLITSAHVVKDSRNVIIGWPERFDRTSLPAEIVSMDTGLDIALLKVDGAHFPAVPVESVIAPGVGDAVIAMGFPAGEELGLDNLTVTRGLLSAFRMDQEAGSRLIQTDATVTLGCSGGPLFDLDTRSVVGIIQGKGMSMLEGFNFAAPVNRLYEFAGIEPETGVDAAIVTIAGVSGTDMSSPSARALDSYDLGVEAQRESSWAEALSHFLTTLRLASEDPQAAYDLAESYAALDQQDQSLRWLERAFQLGYSDFENALEAPGFEDVKNDERFLELVHEF